MVSITQQELENHRIGGVIVSIAADIINYKNVLHVTTDFEVFGSDLVVSDFCRHGSYVLELENVKVLHEVLGRVIASYEGSPPPLEQPPIDEDAFYSNLLDQLCKIEIERVKLIEDLILRHKGTKWLMTKEAQR